MLEMGSKTETCGSVLHCKRFIFIILGIMLSLALSEKINSKECGLSKPTPRIVNGEEATRKEVPWIVHLTLQFPEVKTDKHCGGSIISPSFILTAAHCLIHSVSRKRASQILVNFNSTKPSKGFILLVSVATPHKKYDPRDMSTRAYDIAILKLRDRLYFDDFVKPVCLPQRMWKIGGKLLHVAGWGWTREDKGPGSDVLLRTTTEAMPFKECRRKIPTDLYSFNYVRTICSYPWNGQVCFGDSGGPMTAWNKNGRSVLLGIVQSVTSCNTFRSISFGSRVYGFLPWIKKQMKRMGSSPVEPTKTEEPCD